MNDLNLNILNHNPSYLLVLNEIEDHMISFSSLPLRSHMSRPMNSCEHELSVFPCFQIPANLTIDHIRSPFLTDIPGKLFDPASSAHSGDDAISVARVLQYLIFALHFLVDVQHVVISLYVAYVRT